MKIKFHFLDAGIVLAALVTNFPQTTESSPDEVGTWQLTTDTSAD
jgi:hypothetical protein